MLRIQYQLSDGTTMLYQGAKKWFTPEGSGDPELYENEENARSARATLKRHYGKPGGPLHGVELTTNHHPSGQPLRRHVAPRRQPDPAQYMNRTVPQSEMDRALAMRAKRLGRSWE